MKFKNLIFMIVTCCNAYGASSVDIETIASARTTDSRHKAAMAIQSSSAILDTQSRVSALILRFNSSAAIPPDLASKLAMLKGQVDALALKLVPSSTTSNLLPQSSSAQSSAESLVKQLNSSLSSSGNDLTTQLTAASSQLALAQDKTSLTIKKLTDEVLPADLAGKFSVLSAESCVDVSQVAAAQVTAAKSAAGEFITKLSASAQIPTDLSVELSKAKTLLKETQTIAASLVMQIVNPVPATTADLLGQLAMTGTQLSGVKDAINRLIVGANTTLSTTTLPSTSDLESQLATLAAQVNTMNSKLATLKASAVAVQSQIDLTTAAITASKGLATSLTDILGPTLSAQEKANAAIATAKLKTSSVSAQTTAITTTVNSATVPVTTAVSDASTAFSTASSAANSASICLSSASSSRFSANNAMTTSYNLINQSYTNCLHNLNTVAVVSLSKFSSFFGISPVNPSIILYMNYLIQAFSSNVWGYYVNIGMPANLTATAFIDGDATIPRGTITIAVPVSFLQSIFPGYPDSGLGTFTLNSFALALFNSFISIWE